MATLNLRVNNKKSKSVPSVKHQKNIVPFPSHVLLEFYSLVKNDFAKKTDNFGFFSHFLSSSSVDKQLDLLKKFSINQETVNDKLADIQAVTIAIYLLSDFQCHLKSAALKVLETSTANVKLCTELVNCMKCSVLVEDQGFTSRTILHLSRSQVLSDKVIVTCLSDVVHFLAQAINQHFQHLDDSKLHSTPLEQQGVFSGLHSLCQAALAVLQIAIRNRRYEHFDVLSQALSQVLAHPPSQLPSDTQTTCAMALVLACKEHDSQVKVHPLVWPALVGVANDSQWSCLDGCKLSVRVSLCAALISCHKCEDLCQTMPATLTSKLGFNKSPLSLVEAVFYFLTTNTARSSEPQLLLGGCRALATLGREFASLSRDHNTIMTSLLGDVIDHCLNHLEHHMDSVRHTATALFDSLITAVQGTDGEAAVMRAVKCLPLDSKARFAGVAALATHLGSPAVLQEFADLVPWLLDSAQHFSTAPHARTCFEVLMQRHLDIGAGPWCETWVKPLLERMPCTSLEPVLATAVRFRPHTLPFILQASQDSDDTSHAHSTSKLKVILGCLKTAQKCNLLIGVGDENVQWKGCLDWDQLRLALIHYDDEVRLAAMALITESRKSTESLTKLELDLLLTGFIACGDSHAPATLHKTLGVTKKLFVRLNDSLRGLLKKKEDTGHYFDFVVRLCCSAFSDLFPGSSLGRRSLALKILNFFKEILLSNPSWNEVRAKIFVPEHGQLLLASFTDTYEVNKQLSFDLISCFSDDDLGFNDDAKVAELLDWCIILSESCKPPDSMTAAYVLSMLVTTPCCASIIIQASNINTDLPRLAACHYLIARLEIQLEVAQHSILQAAANGPIYGTVFCLRHLLNTEDLLNPAAFDGKILEEWRSLAENLVEMCFKLNAVVAPIVNSSSPEGHLPMDMESDNIEKLEELVIKDEKSSDVKVTAQMVLLCSWRTIKEVSLLLGELAESKHQLLSNGKLIAIGEHLTSLLCETKHRGAFEQAYVGFCHLCSWLWRVPSGELPQLPAKWLQELLDAISCDSDDSLRLAGKLCATRRSAGVPFIVQALVTTELEVREHPECFPGAMARLLQLAHSSGSLGQVHALNVLRALFRSAQLGEHVAPYIAQGFAVSLQAFRGLTWAERNAATLLFSALMSRVFGVKHTPGHEDLPRKNRMTGRIFFRLYPEMYELLSQELQEGAQMIQSSGAQLTPGLHPALLLLARLYPSSLEGTDSSLNLLSLRDHVVACAASPVLHTRVLAAKALLPLVDPGSLPQFLDTLSLQLQQPHNKLHGTLLQLHGLVDGGVENSDSLSTALKYQVMTGLPLLGDRCCITKYAFVDFLGVVVARHSSVFSPHIQQSLSEKMITIINQPSGIGHSVLKQKCAKLLFLLSPVDSPNSEKLLCSLLDHPLPSVCHETINFLLKKNLVAQFKNSEKIAHRLIQLAFKWAPSEGQAVRTEARVALFRALCAMAETVLCCEWPGTSQKWDKESKIKLILEMTSQGRLGSVNHMLLAFTTHLIRSLDAQLSDELLCSYCDLLLNEVISEDSTEASKIVIAQSLCILQDILFNNHPPTCCTCHTVAMLLVQDNSDNVRHNISVLWPSLSSLTSTSAMSYIAQHLVDQLGASYPQEVVTTLVDWALGDLLTPPKPSGVEYEDRVFFKEDAALNSEELKMTQAACSALASFMSTMTREDLFKVLKEPVKWLPKSTISSPLSNLQDLLDNLEEKSQLPHFLHTDYELCALNYNKLKCLKNILQFN